MAVSSDYESPEDPRANLRRRLINRSAGGPGLDPVTSPVVPPVAPPPGPKPLRIQPALPPRVPRRVVPPVAPAPAPFKPTPGATDPYNGTMFDPRLNDAEWANTPEGLAESNRQNDYLQKQQTQQNAGGQDKKWLDWIHSTYGSSKSRGGGFADLPQGTNLEQVIGRYNCRRSRKTA
jgi:hypothetical protein